MTIPINTLLQGNQSQNPYIGTSSGQSLPILLGPKRFESLYNRPRSKRGLGESQSSWSSSSTSSLLLLLIITLRGWKEARSGTNPKPFFSIQLVRQTEIWNPFVQNQSTVEIANWIWRSAPILKHSPNHHKTHQTSARCQPCNLSWSGALVRHRSAWKSRDSIDNNEKVPQPNCPTLGKRLGRLGGKKQRQNGGKIKRRGKYGAPKNTHGIHGTKGILYLPIHEWLILIVHVGYGNSQKIGLGSRYSKRCSWLQPSLRKTSKHQINW